jgi:hypothetical protein
MDKMEKLVQARVCDLEIRESLFTHHREEYENAGVASPVEQT